MSAAVGQPTGTIGPRGGIRKGLDAPVRHAVTIGGVRKSPSPRGSAITAPFDACARLHGNSHRYSMLRRRLIR